MKKDGKKIHTKNQIVEKGEKLSEIITNASVYLTQVCLTYLLCHIFLIAAMIFLTLSTKSLLVIIVAWSIYALCFVGTFFAIKMSLHNNVYTIYENVLEYGKNNYSEIAQHCNIEKIKAFKSFADKISRENTYSLIVFYKNEKFKSRTIFCVMEDCDKLVKKLYDLKNKNFISKKG